MSRQSLLGLVCHPARRTAIGSVIAMDFGDVDDVVALVNEGLVAVPTLVLFLSKMARNMAVQILLRVESCSARDTLEVLGQVFVNDGVVVQGLLPLETFGADVAQVGGLAGVLPLVDLGLVLVGEHHVAVGALDRLDLAMGGVDVSLQVVGLHEGGSAFGAEVGPLGIVALHVGVQ